MTVSSSSPPPAGLPWQPLVERARLAATRAHAPYSKFRVGAVVVAEGQVVEGCNVENASFGLTICAERVAAFAAVARGLGPITQVALSCVDAAENAGTAERMPCGACRQVLMELGAPGAEVFVDGAGVFSLAQLLPEAFVLPSS